LPGTAYRISRKVLAAAGGAAAFGLIGLIREVATDETLDAAGKAWTIGATVVVVGLVLLWVARFSTTVTDDHITARAARTRRILWSDIQDIRIEVNPGALVKSNVPKQQVIVYRTSGARVVLPFVDEKNLANRRLVLETEVAALRTAWQQRRGPQWRPVPQVQQAAATMARYGVSSWVVGLPWAMLTLAAGVIATVVLLLTDALGDAFGPVMFVLMVIAPVAVYFAVCIGSVVARRRDAAGRAVEAAQEERGSPV